MKLAEIRTLLPGVYQQTLTPGSPTEAVLAVMEALQAPAESALDALDGDFDPLRAPAAFLPFLAQWTDLARLFDDPERVTEADRRAARARRMASIGEGSLRVLIAAAASLARARGTPAGLRRCLELATGVRGFVIDEGTPDGAGRPRAFHFRLRAPEAARRHQALIEHVVALEKPAHVTHEVIFETDPPGAH